MAFGRKNFPVARTNGGADIFRLAGLLGDDNLIRHSEARLVDLVRQQERIVNYSLTASHPLAGLRRGAKSVAKRHRVVRRTRRRASSHPCRDYVAATRPYVAMR